MQSLIYWPSAFGEEVKHVKSLQTDREFTDGQRDAGQKVVRKVHLSFLMKWAIKTFRF